MAVTDVLLLDPTKPEGVINDSDVIPEESGVNCAVVLEAPAAMVIGELIVPMPGLPLCSDTCSDGAPPRNACVPP